MRTIYTPSVIDKETEMKLWDSALIVFDTCALLDFYYMTPDNQMIMSDILSYLSDRIWLPAQVVYEFNKNRDSAMRKPITEKYQDKDILNNKLVDVLKSYISQWEDKYYHPYLDEKKLQDVKDALAIIEPQIAIIKKTVAEEYQARKSEIGKIQSHDVIGSTVKTLSHGEPFTFSVLKKIYAEGKSRYANHIPPGYKDAETKQGTRKYADLVIWKEILQYAKSNERDVILITNDTKADWLIVDESKDDKNSEKPSAAELGNPRRELLAEFDEETGHSIWFYKTADFISKLEEIYQPKQAEIAFYGQLGVVRDVLERLERERDLKSHLTNDSLLIRCDNCGELFPLNSGDLEFNWEGGVVDDRGMGYEMQWDSHEYCNCPHCDHDIELTLQVWEYPMGAFNYQNIEIVGGEIEEPIDLSDYISFDDYEECWKCGERKVLGEHGLCDQCEDEYQRFVNSDD